MDFYLTFLVIYALSLFSFSIYQNFASEYYKHGVTGDAAAYYFHFVDYMSGESRCLLGQNLKSLYPYIFYELSRIFHKKLLYRYPFVQKYIFECILIFIFCMFLLQLNMTVMEVCTFVAIKVIFSEINILVKSNRQFYTFSPRFFGQEFSGLLLACAALADTLAVTVVCSVFLVVFCFYYSHFTRQFLFLVAFPAMAITDWDLFLVVFLTTVSPIYFWGGGRRILQAQINLFKMQYRRINRAQKREVGIRKYLAHTVGEGKQGFVVLSLAAFLIIFLPSTVSLTSGYIVIGWVVVCLTSLKIFEFIGEHWRYAGYINSFLTPMLLLTFLYSNPFAFTVCIFLASVFNFLKIYRYIKDGLGENENKAIHQFLERTTLARAKGVGWCSSPFRLSTIAVNRGLGDFATEFPIGQLGNINSLRNTYPELDVSALKRESGIVHKVTHVLLGSKALSEIENFKNFFNCEVMYADENYTILQVKGFKNA